MSEFSSRVEAQRQILKAVNSKAWKKEQLFALTGSAIQRWATANGVDGSAQLLKLLNLASAQIFVMSNHSDDPIAGTYLITKQRVATLEGQVRDELSSSQFSEVLARAE